MNWLQMVQNTPLVRGARSRALPGLLLASAFVAAVAPAALGQIVFNEVRYKNANGTTTNQVVELKNNSASPVNVGGWILCHQFTYETSHLPGGTSIPAGGYLLVHFNQAGSNTATDVFLSAAQLAASTDIALYVDDDFSNPSKMRAFIQFGSAGGGRESVADAAGLWTVGTFIPAVADGHSIELCNGSPSVFTSYLEQSTPTLGQENGCGVPVTRTTWSVLKGVFH